MQRVKYSFYIIFAMLLAFSQGVSAQDRKVDDLVRRGDSLHFVYRFKEAAEIYREASDALVRNGLNAEDSLLLEDIAGKTILAENGLSMADFTYVPKVIDRRKFSLEDFYLYYPLKDRSWRQIPNQLDTIGSKGLYKAMYIPSDAGSIYYSAVDTSGKEDILFTEYLDTAWTVPVPVNGIVSAFSDEIYPMLSYDRKSLYFSSDGLYGVGGHDIYVSRWDDASQAWSDPVNMGFPYSSPYNDFLYVSDSMEGYVLFASDRECSSDSVWVYVLEADNMPVRQAVEDPEELLNLSRLVPGYEEKTEQKEEDGMPENADKERYMNKMSQVRALRDSISFYTASLDEERNMFALSNDDAERMKLSEIIRRREARVPQLQDQLKKTIAELQEIEMEFLFSGIVVDPDKIMAAATDEDEPEMRYAFNRRTSGGPLSMKFMQPEKGFDYSFMILEEGRFAEDNTIPSGIVYQIQIFSTGEKAEIRDLRGLSPVFETRTGSGRFIYRVGLFSSYEDAMSKLSDVKAAGFRSAFIVAYSDGEEVSVEAARSSESGTQASPDLYEVRIIPSEGELADETAAAIHEKAAGKDIARVETEDGTIIFIVGPFDDKAMADLMTESVIALGIDEVSTVPVANDSVNQ